MKALLLLASTLFAITVQGQGTLNISPLPVTNGLTGTLADSSIVAALYYGPAGTTESSLLLLSPTSPLVNGFAVFGSSSPLPLIPGTSVDLQVRAWTLGYSSYEAAVGSGLPFVLAGTSGIYTATLGGISGPPPIPTPLTFPGSSVNQVPEPASGMLCVFGAGVLWLWRIKGHQSGAIGRKSPTPA